MINEEFVKSVIYRSKYRGCKESDYILGNFISENIDKLSEDEIIIYSDLLKEIDHDIIDWILGKIEVPEKYKTIIGKIDIDL